MAEPARLHPVSSIPLYKVPALFPRLLNWPQQCGIQMRIYLSQKATQTQGVALGCHVLIHFII